jgi:hypothetical protein
MNSKICPVTPKQYNVIVEATKNTYITLLEFLTFWLTSIHEDLPGVFPDCPIIEKTFYGAQF